MQFEHDGCEAFDRRASGSSLALCALSFVRDAHRRDDVDALCRAYGFAQWCHHQRAGSDLPSAVAVSFYEHLFDDWSLHRSVVPWLAPAVRRDIAILWEARLEAAQWRSCNGFSHATSAPGPGYNCER